jgi:rod shape-determining protein MreC
VAKFHLGNYKPIIALGLFLLSWWLVPLFVKSFLRLSFNEIQAPIWNTKAQLDDLANFWVQRNHSKTELIQAGREMARQKAYYQYYAQLNQQLEAEIERLEAILKLPSQRNYRHEVARVIKRDLNAWWQTMEIRKGRNYGIEKGAGVIFAGGVVGKVIEVYAFTSRVELITSPNFRVAASFEKDQRPIIYQGQRKTALGDPLGQVDNVPQDLIAQSNRPLKLITTDYGDTFPAGLKIGSVSWLEIGRTGIFQAGSVQLDPRLLKLDEVTVLIPLSIE